MRTIKAKPISHENFAAYGNFVNVLEPTGSALGTFYNDKVLLSVSGNMPMGFSPLVLDKPERRLIKEVEYHDTTGEVMLPLDDDAISARADRSIYCS